MSMHTSPSRKHKTVYRQLRDHATETCDIPGNTVHIVAIMGMMDMATIEMLAALTLVAMPVDIGVRGAHARCEV